MFKKQHENVFPLPALDSVDYREAELSLAKTLHNLLTKGGNLDMEELRLVSNESKATWAAALETAYLHGLLRHASEETKASLEEALAHLENELHPASADTGPQRWNAPRIFEAPRLRQRLRELDHLAARVTIAQ